jgi:hypothetical protein
MATAHADAWPESGLRGERPSTPPRRTPPPPLPPLPEIGGRRPSRPAPAEARGRTPERGPADRRRPVERSDRLRDERLRDDSMRAQRVRDDLPRSRPPAARRPDPHTSRPVRDDFWSDDERPGRSAADRPGTRRPPAERAVSEKGGWLRGIVAVLGIFLFTLAGGAADSFLDTFLNAGLGMITLVALVASTAIATLLVRRRDMLTVVVSPPLVFVAVATANIALAPKLTMSLPTVATMLIRGFPTMAFATGAAILLALIRLASRR